MADESLSATAIINASAEVIFGVLADPAKHAAIDGTGWVREPLDSKPLTAAGQVFRMAMYHPNHPDGTYQTANRVQIFDPPNAIAVGAGLRHRRRRPGLRRLGLALRPDAARPVRDERHPLLRLVCGPGRHPSSTSASPRSRWSTWTTRWPISPNSSACDQSNAGQQDTPPSDLARPAGRGFATAVYTLLGQTQLSSRGPQGVGTAWSPACVVQTPHDMELHAVQERVIVDGPACAARRRRVSTSGSPVGARSSSVIDENGSRSISSTSIITEPLR